MSQVLAAAEEADTAMAAAQSTATAAQRRVRRDMRAHRSGARWPAQAGRWGAARYTGAAMFRALLPIALLLACTAAAPAEAKRLFVNGDSLAVGTQPYFPGALPGWSIRTSASISRHAFEGPGVLRATGSLPPYVAVSLGTNDDPRHTSGFRSAIRQTMAVVGKDRCVVWATIRRPPVAGASYSGYNQVLKAEARARANLKVVRWRRMVDHHPEWLAGDGVHVSAAGYSARARAFAKKLRRCP
jgi:hypothetical protein